MAAEKVVAIVRGEHGRSATTVCAAHCLAEARIGLDFPQPTRSVVRARACRSQICTIQAVPARSGKGPRGRTAWLPPHLMLARTVERWVRKAETHEVLWFLSTFTMRLALEWNVHVTEAKVHGGSYAHHLALKLVAEAIEGYLANVTNRSLCRLHTTRTHSKPRKASNLTGRWGVRDVHAMPPKVTKSCMLATHSSPGAACAGTLLGSCHASRADLRAERPTRH
jgi:hypothetical protein